MVVNSITSVLQKWLFDWSSFESGLLSSFLLTCLMLGLFVTLAWFRGKRLIGCFTASVSKLESRRECERDDSKCLLWFYRLLSCLSFSDTFDSIQLWIFLFSTLHFISTLIFVLQTLSLWMPSLRIDDRKGRRSSNGYLNRFALLSYVSIILWFISYIFDCVFTHRYFLHRHRRQNMMDDLPIDDHQKNKHSRHTDTVVINAKDKSNNNRGLSPMTNHNNSDSTTQSDSKSWFISSLMCDDCFTSSMQRSHFITFNSLDYWSVGAHSSIGNLRRNKDHHSSEDFTSSQQLWKYRLFCVVLSMINGMATVSLYNSNAFNSEWLDMNVVPNQSLFLFYADLYFGGFWNSICKAMIDLIALNLCKLGFCWLLLFDGDNSSRTRSLWSRSELIVTYVSIIMSLMIGSISGSLWYRRQWFEQSMQLKYCAMQVTKQNLRTHMMFSLEICSQELEPKVHAGMRVELAEHLRLLVERNFGKQKESVPLLVHHVSEDDNDEKEKRGMKNHDNFKPDDQVNEQQVTVHVHRMHQTPTMWRVPVSVFGPTRVLLNLEEQFSHKLINQTKLIGTVRTVFQTPDIQIRDYHIDKPVITADSHHHNSNHDCENNPAHHEQSPTPQDYPKFHRPLSTQTKCANTAGGLPRPSHFLFSDDASIEGETITDTKMTKSVPLTQKHKYNSEYQRKKIIVESHRKRRQSTQDIRFGEYFYTATAGSPAGSERAAMLDQGEDSEQRNLVMADHESSSSSIAEGSILDGRVCERDDSDGKQSELSQLSRDAEYCRTRGMTNDDDNKSVSPLSDGNRADIGRDPEVDAAEAQTDLLIESMASGIVPQFDDERISVIGGSSGGRTFFKMQEQRKRRFSSSGGISLPEFVRMRTENLEMTGDNQTSAALITKSPEESAMKKKPESEDGGEIGAKTAAIKVSPPPMLSRQWSGLAIPESLRSSASVTDADKRALQTEKERRLQMKFLRPAEVDSGRGRAGSEVSMASDMNPRVPGTTHHYDAQIGDVVRRQSVRVIVDEHE